MAGSTIVAVKRALVTALKAEPTLTGVYVSYAHPGDRGRKENLWLGRVSDGEHEEVALKAGRRRREETYELEMHVEVGGTHLTPERAEERALVISTAVEEYVADNPKLGGVTNILFAVVSGIDLTTVETTNGPLANLTLTLTVKARLL